MPNQLSKYPDLAERGDSRVIRSDDLNDGVTMNAGNEITIYSRQVPSDKVYYHGAGRESRTSGRRAFVYADLRNEANEPIEGDLLGVVTDSEQRHAHGEYEIADLETLREAVDDDRTERPMQPIVAPGARDSQHIELQVRAASGSDGETFDRSNSTVELYFTDVRV